MRNRAFSLRSGNERSRGFAAIVLGRAANHSMATMVDISGARSFQHRRRQDK